MDCLNLVERGGIYLRQFTTGLDVETQTRKRF